MKVKAKMMIKIFESNMPKKNTRKESKRFLYLRMNMKM